MKTQQPDAIIIQVGKNGITPGAIAEIKKNLNARKAVKLKILKSQIAETGRESVKEKLLRELNMQVEHKAIGNTILLNKKR